MFLTILGVYAIAGVIGASALALHGYVMNIINQDFETSGKLYTIIYLLSLPFAYIGQNWLYRFGIVKGMVAIHLLLWLAFFAFGVVVALTHKRNPFTDIPFYITILLFYLLPITLGAIIMKWLTQNLSQVKRLVSVDYCMYTLGKNFKKSEKKMSTFGIRKLGWLMVRT
jgi:hypothetical protein